MNLFKDNLANSDKEIFDSIQKEFQRQQEGIELIASENIVSKAVLEAQGSILTNKYAEGYPGRRYYHGCECVDVAEKFAIDRAKKLFHCNFANVQPHSGSQANQAVFLALLKPDDVILGMSLPSGGHLTHGAKPNLSGKWFHAVGYDVNPETYLIDYDEVQKLAHEYKPKLLIAGGSAYPRLIDFAKMREIADSVGAYLMVDMAHFAGLVAAGIVPSPLEFADVVTTTTHKTLRGPRGGMILSNNEELGKKINSAIFPGLQGGPLMHVIAAKAVAFKEALSEDFVNYSKQVLKNAKALAESLIDRGLEVVTGGTDTHLLLVDLRSKNLTGDVSSQILDDIGIICNKNTIPFDTQSPTITSGIRLGSPAGTTRGFKEEEFKEIANIIADILDELSQNGSVNDAMLKSAKTRVKDLCFRYPIY